MELMMIEALSLNEEVNVTLTAGWKDDEQIRIGGDMRVTADLYSQTQTHPPSAKPSWHGWHEYDMWHGEGEGEGLTMNLNRTPQWWRSRHFTGLINHAWGEEQALGWAASLRAAVMSAAPRVDHRSSPLPAIKGASRKILSRACTCMSQNYVGRGT